MGIKHRIALLINRTNIKSKINDYEYLSENERINKFKNDFANNGEVYQEAYLNLIMESNKVGISSDMLKAVEAYDKDYNAKLYPIFVETAFEKRIRQGATDEQLMAMSDSAVIEVINKKRITADLNIRQIFLAIENVYGAERLNRIADKVIVSNDYYTSKYINYVSSLEYLPQNANENDKVYGNMVKFKNSYGINNSIEEFKKLLNVKGYIFTDYIRSAGELGIDGNSAFFIMYKELGVEGMYELNAFDSINNDMHPYALNDIRNSLIDYRKNITDPELSKKL